MHGLPLRGCGDLAVSGQMTEKAIDLGFAHIFWMSLASVEFDKPENPVAVGLFRAIGIVMVSQNLPDLIHQTQIGIRPKFFLAFHLSPTYFENMETGTVLFP